MTQNKNLTFRYCIHQIIYWAGAAGITSFAATYLLSKGFSAAHVGWIMFGAYLGSFAVQPVVAGYADKARRNILPGLMVILSVLSIICFAAVWLTQPRFPVFAALYLLGVMFYDMQIPLLNSLNVYYSMRSWKMNYGLARGLGGAGFAVATLFLGFGAKTLGTDCIIITSIVLMAVYAAVSATYPKDESLPASTDGGNEKDTSSLAAFVAKYKWYCVSLLGVLMIAMFHIMTENYLINILGRLGGDSSNVGIALFIATAVELPMMSIFVKIYDRLGSYKILLISGFAFTVKGILFILAKSVTAIYLIQLLQCVTYVMISMIQMYYARECTDVSDMIKGQSSITAAYTLGCAIGNLVGGNIISAFGVPAMLKTAATIAAAGFLVIIPTTKKALKQIQN